MLPTKSGGWQFHTVLRESSRKRRGCTDLQRGFISSFRNVTTFPLNCSDYRLYSAALITPKATFPHPSWRDAGNIIIDIIQVVKDIFHGSRTQVLEYQDIYCNTTTKPFPYSHGLPL